MIAQSLTIAIAAVCPIHGVSIGRKDDKSTWRIDFKEEATPAQRAAAAQVVAQFAPLLVIAKAAKVAQVNAMFEAAAARLTAEYPDPEKLTWPLQEREALAWQADNAAPTPYINALAAARGITRVDYLNRTLTKVGQFRAASAVLVGRRQRYEDEMKAAELAGDAAAIDAIEPDFRLS